MFLAAATAVAAQVTVQVRRHHFDRAGRTLGDADAAALAVVVLELEALTGAR
jgi:hypothetical protein